MPVVLGDIPLDSLASESVRHDNRNRNTQCAVPVQVLATVEDILSRQNLNESNIDVNQNLMTDFPAPAMSQHDLNKMLYAFRGKIVSSMKFYTIAEIASNSTTSVRYYVLGRELDSASHAMFHVVY